MDDKQNEHFSENSDQSQQFEIEVTIKPSITSTNTPQVNQPIETPNRFQSNMAGNIQMNQNASQVNNSYISNQNQNISSNNSQSTQNISSNNSQKDTKSINTNQYLFDPTMKFLLKALRESSMKSSQPSSNGLNNQVNALQQVVNALKPAINKLQQSEAKTQPKINTAQPEANIFPKSPINTLQQTNTASNVRSFQVSPTSSQSTFSQPTLSQSTPNKSIFSQPASNQSIFSQPASNQSTLSQPTSNQSIFSQSTPNKSIFSQPSSNQSIFSQKTSNQSTLSQPASNQSIFSQQTSNQSTLSQPASNQSTSNQSIFSQQTSNQSTLSQPASNQSIFSQQTSNQSALNQPSSNQSTFNQNTPNQPTLSQPTLQSYFQPRNTNVQPRLKIEGYRMNQANQIEYKYYPIQSTENPVPLYSSSNQINDFEAIRKFWLQNNGYNEKEPRLPISKPKKKKKRRVSSYLDYSSNSPPSSPPSRRAKEPAKNVARKSGSKISLSNLPSLLTIDKEPKVNILGIVQQSPIIKIAFQTEDSKNVKVIPAREARKLFPMQLSKFYEGFVTFIDYE